MDARKRKALEEMGGSVTTVEEFLGLTPAESALIEMRLQLIDQVRMRRRAAGMTQKELAKLTGSSQARIAKMENGDPQTSLEALFSAVVVLGGHPVLSVRDQATQRPVQRHALGDRPDVVVRRPSAAAPQSRSDAPRARVRRVAHEAAF